MENALEKRQYPIGRFVWPDHVSPEDIREAIRTIEAFPGRLRARVEQMAEAELDTAYRPGGWTCRQVVHHLADSHMNAFIRFKLALTEDAPVIKPYREGEWAKGPDYHLAPAVSLEILHHVHHRWSVLMASMSPADWDRTYVHPEYGQTYTLGQVVKMYAWHGAHHLAHIIGDQGSVIGDL